MIYLKVHRTEQGHILAMCDESLIDKVLQEGEIELNIKDYSDFYKGELINASRINEKIRQEDVYSANVVGEESIDAAIASSLISKENVKRVKKVPYANAFRIKY